MPEEEVLAAGLRNAGVEHVLKAKKRWGVAAMALTYRLHELGVTTDWTYTSTCRRLAQMGYPAPSQTVGCVRRLGCSRNRSPHYASATSPSAHPRDLHMLPTLCAN